MAGFVQNGLGNIARVGEDTGNAEDRRASDGTSAVERGIEEDADAFDGVTHTADQEVTPQGARQADAGPGAGFVVEISQAQVIRFPVIEVQSQSQLASEEPRFDERELVSLPLGAQLHAQPEFLAGAREPRRVEQIKVALADFDKGDDRVNGTEAGAEREVAGV